MSAQKEYGFELCCTMYTYGTHFIYHSYVHAWRTFTRYITCEELHGSVTGLIAKGFILAYVGIKKEPTTSGATIILII